MTVTLAYDATLSRVRVTATGLGTAVLATVQRSPDQVRWTTVRGGENVPAAAGSLSAPVDDYEFASGINYYRVSYLAAPTFVAAGTAAHATNASVTPGMPAGVQVGDVVLLLAAIRNSGTGTVNTPAGWTLLLDGSNMRLYGRINDTGDTAPTVTFTGGVSGADTSAQLAALRGLTLDVVGATAVGSTLNGSAQDIAVAALTLAAPATEGVVIHCGWKADDWTSVAVVTDGTEIGEPDTTTGDDQGIVWDYRIMAPTTAFSTIGARTFAVTGGASAISRGGAAVLTPATTTQSASIAPTLTDVWLKSIGRPFLNRPLPACDLVSDVTRPPRGGLFDVLGRSHPVAVTEVRGSRRYTLQILTDTTAEADDLDLALASGDPLYLHTPAAFLEPSMYCIVGDASKRHVRLSARCVFTLPLVEVAAPGPGIVGGTATWQTVLSTYTTWADVLAAHPTWADVLELVADPSEVIVP